MKQNKYKEKLQNRAIDPSSDSWERLQIKLDSHGKTEKGKKWQFLKYAAAVLIMASVGFYFSERDEEVIKDPKIVMPSQKEDLNNIYEMNNEPETEVASSPVVSDMNKPIETKQDNIPSNRAESGEEVADLANPDKETAISAIQVTEKGIHDTLSEAFVQAGAVTSEEKALEDEVAQLLSQSKIKLSINAQISSKKVVSAHALLNEVEVDLNKDLKQKLLEKIAKTLKNPKEVITYQEN